MTDPAFDPAQVFQVNFGMRHVDTAGFDRRCRRRERICVKSFCGGRIAITAIFSSRQLLRKDLEPGLTWFEADVYAGEPLDPALFAAHSVVTFVLYRAGKRLGRITGGC